MADITKCSGEGCPIKEGCYRFTAKDSPHQSYFAEVPGKRISKHEAGMELPQDYSGSISLTEFICDFYWGDQQGIFENLQKIVQGKKC